MKAVSFIKRPQFKDLYEAVMFKKSDFIFLQSEPSFSFYLILLSSENDYPPPPPSRPSKLANGKSMLNLRGSFGVGQCVFWQRIAKG